MFQLANNEERAQLAELVWGRNPDQDVSLTSAPPSVKLTRERILSTVGVLALGMAGMAAAYGMGTLTLVLGLGGLAATTPSLFRDRLPLDRRLISRRKRLRPSGRIPQGASTGPAGNSGNRRTGRIVSGDTLRAPLSTRPCVAFCAVLKDTAGVNSETMLIDGATAGFRVDCSDGILEIPAGPINLTHDGVLIEPFAARLHMSALDPLGESSDGADPFPHDSAHESIICIGDEIEILAQTEVVPDTGAEPSGYRTQAKSIHRAVGLASVRRIAGDIKE